MLLTIDIGNTNLTLGLYDANNMVAHWRLATDHARMRDEYGLQFQGLLQNVDHSTKELTGICLASVVPQLTSRVVQACREYLNQEPFIVDVGIKTGIKVKYDDPRAVGADHISLDSARHHAARPERLDNRRLSLHPHIHHARSPP